ncbi:hypothetical protein DVH24_000747 [Malus domestica]|uniref:Uncharacterized protein n=1 Tax=Malus domestica TaxID=3750 RepID=A0A498K4C4_MALDO|nr:hypothetical protein DVH24_000747 [Malus domestica]
MESTTYLCANHRLLPPPP